MHRWWTRKLLVPVRRGNRLHRLWPAGGRHGRGSIPSTAASVAQATASVLVATVATPATATTAATRTTAVHRLPYVHAMRRAKGCWSLLRIRHQPSLHQPLSRHVQPVCQPAAATHATLAALAALAASTAASRTGDAVQQRAQP